jgi:hypothetical protein
MVGGVPVDRALDEARHPFGIIVLQGHCQAIEVDQALLYRACLEWVEARELARSHCADGRLAIEARASDRRHDGADPAPERLRPANAH